MSGARRRAVRDGNVIMTALIASFPAPRLVVTSLAMAVAATVATSAVTGQFPFIHSSPTAQSLTHFVQIKCRARSRFHRPGNDTAAPVHLYLPSLSSLSRNSLHGRVCFPQQGELSGY